MSRKDSAGASTWRNVTVTKLGWLAGHMPQPLSGVPRAANEPAKGNPCGLRIPPERFPAAAGPSLQCNPQWVRSRVSVLGRRGMVHDFYIPLQNHGQARRVPAAYLLHATPSAASENKGIQPIGVPSPRLLHPLPTSQASSRPSILPSYQRPYPRSVPRSCRLRTWIHGNLITWMGSHPDAYKRTQRRTSH